MVVREQTLVTLTIDEIRRKLPFSVLGLDVDNDSAFINERVLAYCAERRIQLTRSRAYKKNDQAWIEQEERRGGAEAGRICAARRRGSRDRAQQLA